MMLRAAERGLAAVGEGSVAGRPLATMDDFYTHIMRELPAVTDRLATEPEGAVGMADWRTLKRAVFARHSNPWSAWTRWASAPLVLLPVWRRSWRDATLVGVWMAVNPVVFGKPTHERAWATRAVLGEERWIEERPMDAAMAVDAGATTAIVAAMIAARQRRAAPAALAMATLMALLLWYWELMARYHGQRDDQGDAR